MHDDDEVGESSEQVHVDGGPSDPDGGDMSDQTRIVKFDGGTSDQYNWYGAEKAHVDGGPNDPDGGGMSD